MPKETIAREAGHTGRSVTPAPASAEAAAAEPADAVLLALRDYREAEERMRARTRSAMGMGVSDMTAIRYIISADRAGAPLTATELATALDISTASTTKLIDRLVGLGHVERQGHPTDRRSLVLLPTPASRTAVHGALSGAHERMREAAGGLSAEAADALVRFFDAASGVAESSQRG